MDLDAIISLQKHTIDGLRADLARQRDLIRELEANASLHWITEEELKQVRADLARVTAERDRYRDRLELDPGGGDKIDEFESASEHLRARVAELEEREVTWRAAQKACETCDAPTYAEFRAVKQRNAELVAALTDIRDMPGSDQNAPYRLRKLARGILARAESATCQKATNPSQISSGSATPAKRQSAS